MSASFDNYKIFYYVGRYGNITHAASALFLSQSTVSRGIQSLEAELGCRLFERYLHGVKLTREGEALYARVAPACEQILLGEEDIKRAQNNSGRPVRLCADDYAYFNYVLPAIREFAEVQPTVRLELVSVSPEGSGDVFTAITDGSVDIACTSQLAPSGAGLNITKIGEYKDVIIAGDKFSGLIGRTWELSELSGLPFASLCYRGGDDNYLERLFALYGVSVSPVFCLDSISRLLPLVSEGICLAVIPGPFQGRIYNNIFEVRLKTAMPTRTVCVVTSDGVSLSPAADAFVRHLKKSSLRSR